MIKGAQMPVGVLGVVQFGLILIKNTIFSTFSQQNLLSLIFKACFPLGK